MREVAQIVPKMVKGSAKLAPRWANFVPKMANLVPLWRLPGPRSAPDANRSEVSGEVKAKMGPSWAKLRSSCGQDGPSYCQAGAKMSQLCPKMANLRPLWGASWSLSPTFSVIFTEMAEV